MLGEVARAGPAGPALKVRGGSSDRVASNKAETLRSVPGFGCFRPPARLFGGSRESLHENVSLLGVLRREAASPEAA